VRILIVHNHYQRPGGEDVGVCDESGVLREHGHEVELLEADNDHIHGFLASAKTALTSIYNRSSKRRMAAALARVKPDIVHVHNFFPVFSPSIYYACIEAGIPLVQTLHNYRLVCPSGILFRDGKVCEDCLGRKFAWPGVLHGCYRNSRAGTACVATMNFVHRWMKTYERASALIVLTEFARCKFLEAGFRADKLVVKSPFVDVDPGIGNGKGDYFLFVGRLSEEKGILPLMKAWKELGTLAPLRIAGDGPLADYCRHSQESVPGIEFLGHRSRSEINELMKGARALIFPSLWYEGVPRTILESFATGTPVIASKLGSMETLVQDRWTGLHFEAGEVAALTGQVKWALEHPPEWQRMRELARAEYEAKYCAEPNYQMLMRIYEAARSRTPLPSAAAMNPLSAITSEV